MIFCTQLTFDLFLRLRSNYRLGIHPYVFCHISRNNISIGRRMHSILPSKVKISIFFQWYCQLLIFFVFSVWKTWFWQAGLRQLFCLNALPYIQWPWTIRPWTTRFWTIRFCKILPIIIRPSKITPWVTRSLNSALYKSVLDNSTLGNLVGLNISQEQLVIASGTGLEGFWYGWVSKH